MTELELLRWILGIIIAAGAMALTVMYFFRSEPLVVPVGGQTEPTGKTEMPEEDRMQLQASLLSADAGNGLPIPASILESDAYGLLQQSISAGTVINESSPVWDELEKAVAVGSPKFKNRLYVLGGGELKPSDLHMALLIRCGVTPANIAMLVGRSKPTVTFRRKDMGRKLFDQNLDANRVDELIRLI